jgi:hypothetical protein
MRVLVCGGRDYRDGPHLFATLTGLNISRGPISHVIHGCAKGADSLAAQWAANAGADNVVQVPFRADWTNFGRRAGPIRNQRMLDEGKPDVVVAFPGGSGTADMVRRAKAAGLEVIEVS